MIRFIRNGLVGLTGILLAFSVLRSSAQDVSKPPPITAKGAIAPVAPPLPAVVVAALQAGRYADALATLDRIEPTAKTASDRAYFALVRGTTLRLGGQSAASRTVLEAALKAAPRGPWAAKLRSELAALELAAGHFDAAEALARVDAETLLEPGRKDRLAEVYHEFARRLLEPADPITPADPNGAYELLARARSLAKSDTLRAALLFSMGRASQTGGQQPRAIQEFQAYLAEYPKGAERAAARFYLGDAQARAGQPLPARLTWGDLARELGKKDGRTKDEDSFRARAMFELTRTYGIPQPPDKTSLNLGVAALRRFLAEYPAHPLSVQAAHELGVSYAARGMSQEALDAFTTFLKEEGFRAETEEAKRELVQRSMAATFQMGQILQGQRKFAEAIAAWKGYLAKYPDGPESAAAQRAILDTHLLIADDHRQRKQYSEARAGWRAFAAQNPLDSRVPQLLFNVGESFTTERKFDDAIAAWGSLLSKFPQTEVAAHAQFLIASIFENEKGDMAEAVEKYKKVAIEPWQSQARVRVAVMESKALKVVTPRAFRSGEKPHLKITTRNLEKLTFTAFRLNPEAYFRKKQVLSGMESLDIGLVQPDAEWTESVPGFARYKPVDKDYELAKLEVPGVYVVRVTDEKNLQATTLVLGSDVDAIVKTSQSQLLVFAQDMKTGRGRAGARVLIANAGKVILDAKTGADGVLLHTWAELPQPASALNYLVLDGKHAAGSVLAVPDGMVEGLSPRAYLYTDRPAYRPGQKVEIRGVVRETVDGQYANKPGAVYRFEVTDSRGRQLVARSVRLSAYGTFHESVPLDVAAPAGSYKMTVYQPGKNSFAGAFEVQSYRLEPIDLAFDLKKTVFFRGETIKADLVAKYQYGAPVANRALDVQLPDGRVLHGTTDAGGKYHFEFSTEGFDEEQRLRLTAHLTQDNVAAAAIVMLAVRAFTIDVHTTREVYLDGESFQVDASTIDAQGKPVGETLSIAVLKQVEQAGRVSEREVARKELKTDAKMGKGSLSFKVDDEQGGSFIVRASGKDQFGNAVVADRAVMISGQKDETKLRILADRQTYKVGEEASVNLYSRGRSGVAVLAWEADRILSYKLVDLHDGDNRVAWVVDGPQFPNFTLTAARMAGTAFDEAKLDVKVERDLRVTVTPVKAAVGPNDEIEVEITTVDQLGRPVAAELSLALVDRSLLRLFGDKLPNIGAYFYDQTRTGSFATRATNTFKYEPQATPVSEAVVEDAERGAAIIADRSEVDRWKSEVERLQREVKRGVVDPRILLEAEKERVLAEAKVQAAPMAVPPAGRPTGVDMGGKDAAINGGQALLGGSRRSGRVRQAQAEEGWIENDRKGPKADAKAIEYSDSEHWRDLSENRDKWYALSGSGGFGSKAGRLGRAKESPRQRFVETAYWNPSVVTGADGKTRLKLRAPAALSSYVFTARGVTGSDTLAGQAVADITVRKDFFVDLKAPASLTQGDKPRFVARVHHLGVTGAVELKLSVYAGGREQVFPKSLDVKKDGIDEILFEAVEVPDGDNVRVTLSANAGEAKDQLVAEIPIRPWGVQAFASASGTSSDNATVFVSLPAGRAYESPEMLVVVSPSVRRMLVELALGRDAYSLGARLDACVFVEPPSTTADRAGDLLAAAAALGYLRTVRASAPEAERLTARIQGLVSELIAAQNDDGGWPWVGGEVRAQTPTPSDPLASARVVWALASAEPLGLLTDPKTLDKSAAYLTQEFAKAAGNDHDTRAVLLHALSTRGKATFEQANALNRVRQAISDAALGYLALSMANLDRVPMAGEVLDVLAARAKTEKVTPGARPRRYWEGQSTLPFNRGVAEATALATFAFSRARPQDPIIAQAADWLLAHRDGTGWQPGKAKGPALAALAGYYGTATTADDRYRLVVTVNGIEVLATDVAGAAEGKAILVPRNALKVGDKNRIHFAIDGRGTFGYAVTLTGFTREFAPDQDLSNRTAILQRRVYLPDAPELDGKVLPQGFSVAVGATSFENHASQLALGGKARVRIDAARIVPEGRPAWEQDFLVVQEHLPAGTTLVEGSVRSQADSFTMADDVLTFYFSPQKWPGTIEYEVFGYLPGQYRALPASIRSAYEPGRSHLGQPGTLRILAPGEPNTDPYKPTPDELFARGKAHFDAGRLAEASASLEPLFAAYTLNDAIAKDAARMLLLINIRDYNPRKVVQYFEVVKEKAPELVVKFDDLLVVGRAYRDINEFERAYLVWRGVAEASYLEDARIGEALRQRNKALEGTAYLIDLWREYPDTASIQADLFGLSQVLAQQAGKAIDDPVLRKALADAGVTRSELLLQAIRLVQAFLARAPRSPLADEASLALVGNFLDLEDDAAVVELASRFAKLYAKSKYLDSFQYSEALGEFHLSHYDRAAAVAESIAKSVYKDADGVERPSPNKWQALYILGQIYDARRQPGRALTYYDQVKEQFSDAAGAIRFYRRKALSLPEVTVVRPEGGEAVAGPVGRGLRAVAPAAGKVAASELKMDFRNLAEVDVTVYPVDLMRLYLTRRSLDSIAAIDLAGITPLLERKVKLGDGEDFDDKVKALDLPLDKEGAYLVMVRGGELYASGVVIVSPLELEILEEAEASRVRVTVRDARTKALMPKVQVKVIGDENGKFVSGETDLRGVFVADGVQGLVTAVSRRGTAQYAFYRGKTHVGPRRAPAPQAPGFQAPAPQAPAKQENASELPNLNSNLKSLNFKNQDMQIERLQKRYQQGDQGGAKVNDFK